MEKGAFVKDIKPGLKISGIFIIHNPSLCPSGRGAFWKFTLADATGSLPAKIWFPKSAEFAEIPSGCVAEATGAATLYSGQIQLTVENMKILENNPQVNPAWFLPQSPFLPEAMFLELRNLCLKELTHKPWRKLVLGILDDETISRKFQEAPAAKSIHQAYLGGLLEHTLNVAKLCMAIADNYPALDRQTLLAGAVLHDIGKIEEYCWDNKFDSTDSGELLGHLYLGLELIAPRLSACGLEPELADHIRHLVLSHHGEYAYGSPRLPQTPEAFVLHFADNIDAKLAQCEQAQPLEGSSWTEKQWALGRRIYKGPRTPGRGKNGARNNQDQECLFLLKE